MKRFLLRNFRGLLEREISKSYDTNNTDSVFVYHIFYIFINKRIEIIFKFSIRFVM